MRYLVYLVTTLITSLFSFRSWKDMYTGEYKGMKYRIQSQETKGPCTNSFKFRLKLGNYRPVKIDIHHTNWGAPYNVDIFKGVKHIMFDNIEKEDPILRESRSSVLYIPCKGENDKTCNAYFDLFEHEWDNLKTVFLQSNSRYLPRIMGIVAGKNEDFERVFIGKYKNKEYQLTVEADGMVSIQPTNKKEDYSITTRLYPSLLMPGEKIAIDSIPDNITVEDITRFKDDKGYGPEHYFGIEVVSFEAMRLEDIKAGLQKAFQFYEQKDLEKAGKYFHSISIQSYGKSNENYLAICDQYMGKIAFLQGKTYDAETHYKNALIAARNLPELRDSIQKDMDEHLKP